MMAVTNPAPPLPGSRVRKTIDTLWQGSILEALKSYIAIPCKSPAFDPAWEANGYLEAAAELLAARTRSLGVPGSSISVHRLPGRTPFLLVEIDGDTVDHVLFYGHLDKQPEMEGWAEGLGPWLPVLAGGRLYGRGGGDDGYAVFAAGAAIAALKSNGQDIPRCTILIEASEESGSPDLAAYLDHFADRIPAPSLVIGLDAECATYDRLWRTVSLRGLIAGTLTVSVLEEGAHSGMASGIAPDPFRVARALLDRIEDPVTGTARLDALITEIPPDRRRELEDSADLLGASAIAKISWASDAQPIAQGAELLLANMWQSSLTVTGIAGLPRPANAGNLLHPQVSLKFSIRVPPNCDVHEASRAVARELMADPRLGAAVTVRMDTPLEGWNAPHSPQWLDDAIERASLAVFGQSAMSTGAGGTIPFASILAERFPKVPIFFTGVLGPKSNAHAPNEYLALDYAADLTHCLSLILAEIARTPTQARA